MCTSPPPHGSVADKTDREQAAEIREEHDFLDDLNLHAAEGITTWLEPSLRDAQPEERFQFQRHDSHHGTPVFNRVVTLRDSQMKGR